jgi:hypothetical protein
MLLWHRVRICPVAAQKDGDIYGAVGIVAAKNVSRLYLHQLRQVLAGVDLTGVINYRGRIVNLLSIISGCDVNALRDQVLLRPGCQPGGSGAIHDRDLCVFILA